MTILSRVAALLLSWVFAACALAQTTVTLQQGLNNYAGAADAFLFSAGPDQNINGGLQVRSETSDVGVVRFKIFAADGGPVPNSATITSATLSLYRFQGPDTTFKLWRLLKNWDEAQATWNVAATGVPWTTPGALSAGSDYVATADGQGSLTSAAANNCDVTAAGPFPAACWLNIDVTSGVQAFAANPAQNFGWKLAAISSSSPGNYNNFIPKEQVAYPGELPKLTITYTTATASCNSGSSRPFDQAPVSGSPIQISASGTTSFEAEHFNCGGQNVAYHDNVPGNAGNANFRAAEDVDIRTSTGSATPVVTNFETGEWLTYTINVAAGGVYDIAVSASNNDVTAQFHLEIDNANVGAITVPATGGWDTFNWFSAIGVSLSAGQHVLKLYSDQQYATPDQIRFTAFATPAACNTGTLRPFDQAPVNGNPISIPSSGATFEAEHFNCGGQNVAYHDNVPGNAGNANFRTAEDVDIRTSTGSTTPAVTNFETGEWLTYTINVAAAGTYDIGVSASNGGTAAQFHLEIDNTNVGTIPVPATGGWDTFNWFSKTGVPLNAGQHVLKLQADQQYATPDQIRVMPAGGGGGGGGSSCGSANLCVNWQPAETQFNTPPPSNTNPPVPWITTTGIGTPHPWEVQTFARCTDQNNLECRNRVQLVSPGRDDDSAIRISTMDLDQYDGATWERTQLNLSATDTDVSEGAEQWWAHSILIPADSMFGDPHEWGSSFMSFAGGDAVIFVLGIQQFGSTPRTFFRAFTGGQGGDPNSAFEQYSYNFNGVSTQSGQCIYDDFQPDVWYDFVHHIKWSALGNGRHEIWMRKAGGPVKKVLDRGVGAPQGLNRPISTMFSTGLRWLKLGSYHDPVPGKNTAAIHDRLRRGTSPDAVRMADFPVDLNAPVTNPDGTLVGCPHDTPVP